MRIFEQPAHDGGILDYDDIVNYAGQILDHLAIQGAPDEAYESDKTFMACELMLESQAEFNGRE